MTTIKILRRAKNQTIDLPEELHFEPGIDEVEIRREGRRLILEPVTSEDWPEDFWRAFEGMPEGFESVRKKHIAPPATAEQMLRSIGATQEDLEIVDRILREIGIYDDDPPANREPE